MRKVLSNISLILECRDARVPLTSTNPLLESSLAGRERIIIYTKADLCAPGSANRWFTKQEKLLGDFHSRGALDAGGDGEAYGEGAGSGRTEVVFTDEANPRSITRLLQMIKERATAHSSDSLLGMRALVVGMPNAGKSTLLNALRRVSLHKSKAARTGAQPGVTRKLSTPVRIIEPDSAAGLEEGVFVVDTPGVFIPYVSDVESMLKLSLVGCVKDGLVPVTVVADYLLFQLNLRDPDLYAELSPPTNDVGEWLEAVARRTGKLLKGGVPATEQAADWIVQQWRKGTLGKFGLDEVSAVSLENWRRRQREGGEVLSMNQARKKEKEARKVRNAAKRAEAAS
jgi:mitochondrial GTPase 1